MKGGALFWGFFCFVLMSCGHRPDETRGHFQENIPLEWPDDGEKAYSDIVDSVKYISLETHPDGLFDGEKISKILLRNGKIFIYDRRKTNALLMFDISGKFERRIGKRGGGPGEYNILWGFTVDDQYIYLLDLSKKSVLVFDYSGGHVKDLKMPFSVTDMAVLDNGDFIVTTHTLFDGTVDKSDVPYRIALVDGKFNIKNRLFKMNGTDSQLAMEYYLTYAGDKICYQNYVQDSLIVFDRKTGDYMTYSFEFPKKVPADLRSGSDFARQGFQFLGDNVGMVLGKYVVGSVALRPFVMDTQTQQVYRKGPFCIKNEAEYQGYVVSTFTGRYYRFFVEKGVWPRASQAMDEFFLEDEENVGLLLYKLKP